MAIIYPTHKNISSISADKREPPDNGVIDPRDTIKIPAAKDLRCLAAALDLYRSAIWGA